MYPASLFRGLALKDEGNEVKNIQIIGLGIFNYR